MLFCKQCISFVITSLSAFAPFIDRKVRITLSKSDERRKTHFPPSTVKNTNPMCEVLLPSTNIHTGTKRTELPKIKIQKLESQPEGTTKHVCMGILRIFHFTTEVLLQFIARRFPNVRVPELDHGVFFLLGSKTWQLH